MEIVWFYGGPVVLCKAHENNEREVNSTEQGSVKTCPHTKLTHDSSDIIDDTSVPDDKTDSHLV